MTTRSEQTNEIVAALAKAKLEFGKLGKSGTDSHNKKNGRDRKYATLADIEDATAEALAKQGIIVHQGCRCLDSGDWVMVTTLMHSSGQWIETPVPIFQGQRPGAQGFGSGITYARRYGKQSALDISPDEEDDDGRAADGHQARTAAPARAEPRRQEAAPQPARQIDQSKRSPAFLAREFADRIIAEVNGLEFHDATEVLERNTALLERLRTAFPDMHRDVMIAAGMEEPEPPAEPITAANFQAPHGDEPRRAGRQPTPPRRVAEPAEAA